MQFKDGLHILANKIFLKNETEENILKKCRGKITFS